VNPELRRASAGIDCTCRSTHLNHSDLILFGHEINVLGLLTDTGFTFSPTPSRSLAPWVVWWFQDRRERLRQLALETIDLNKDPYFMMNHLGGYECKLCLTLHTNEGSYLAHTQGKKHMDNL
jgi:hypothetical protein